VADTEKKQISGAILGKQFSAVVETDGEDASIIGMADGHPLEIHISTAPTSMMVTGTLLGHPINLQFR